MATVKLSTENFYNQLTTYVCIVNKNIAMHINQLIGYAYSYSHICSQCWQMLTCVATQQQITGPIAKQMKKADSKAPNKSIIDIAPAKLSFSAAAAVSVEVLFIKTPAISWKSTDVIASRVVPP